MKNVRQIDQQSHAESNFKYWEREGGCQVFKALKIQTAVFGQHSVRLETVLASQLLHHGMS